MPTRCDLQGHKHLSVALGRGSGEALLEHQRLNGTDFIATNGDGSFSTPEGLNPDTGMVIGALQATSGVSPTVMGKPEAAIFQTAR